MAGKNEQYGIAFQIGAKLQSSFPAAFKAAEKQIAALQKAAKNTGQAWSDLTKKTGSLIKQMSLLSTAVVGGAFALAKTTASAAKSLGDLSTRTGMGVEGLQAYQYAALQSGMKIEQFDQSLQKFRSTLAKGTKDAKSNPLAEFGLSAKKLYAMKPELALQRVADYMNTIKDPAKKARLAVAMFGEEAGPRMQALLAQGSAGLKKAQEEFQKTGGGFNEQDIENANKFESAWHKIGYTLDNIKNKIGAKLLPAFTELFERVGEAIQGLLPQINQFAEWMARAIQDNAPLVREFAQRMIDLGKEIWAVVLRVKDFVGGWENVAKILVILKLLPIAVSAVTFAMKLAALASTGFAAAVKLLTAAMAANPIGLIVIAIAAVVAGLIWAYKNCETFRNVVNSVAAFIADKFRKLAEGIKAIFGKLWPTLQAAFAKLNEAGGRVFDRLKAAWDRIWPKLKAAFSTAFDALRAAWETVWPVLQAGFQMIATVAEKVMAVIGPIFEAGFDLVVDIIRNAMSLVGPIFDTVINILIAFIDVFTGNWSMLGDDVKAVVESFTGVFDAVFNAVVNIGRSFADKLMAILRPIADFLGGITSKIGTALDTAKNLGSTIKGKIGGLFGGGDEALPGHAEGGIFTKPHIASFAENAPRVPEAAIPVENTQRSFDLWKRTGEMAGFATRHDVSPAREAAAPVENKRRSLERISPAAPRVPEAARPVADMRRSFDLRESISLTMPEIPRDENARRPFDLWRRIGEIANKLEAPRATMPGSETARPNVMPMMPSSGPTNLSISMPINISGNATPETAQALEQSRGDIMADVKRMVNDALAERTSRERRLAYAY